MSTKIWKLVNLAKGLIRPEPQPEPTPEPEKPKLVYVASPLRSNDYMTQEGNLLMAERFGATIASVYPDGSVIPFIPHLLFTRFLDAENEAEDALAIKWNEEMLRRCDELWVFPCVITQELSLGILCEVEWWLEHKSADTIVYHDLNVLSSPGKWREEETEQG